MRYIDVTLTLEPGMRGIEIESAKSLEKDGWNAKMIHLYSHAGTHMDAPIHFNVNKKTIDKIPIDRFFVNCYIVDLTGIKPQTEIQISDLGSIKNNLSQGEGLIFRTGWSKQINKPIYRNGLPSISKKLALWCVNRKISLVGVEPPSVADVNNLPLLTEIHRILMDGDVIIVEGLANLETISSSKVQLIVFPLKIKDGDGAPCRAIIIEE